MGRIFPRRANEVPAPPQMCGMRYHYIPPSRSPFPPSSPLAPSPSRPIFPTHPRHSELSRERGVRHGDPPHLSRFFYLSCTIRYILFLSWNLFAYGLLLSITCIPPLPPLLPPPLRPPLRSSPFCPRFPSPSLPFFLVVAPPPNPPSSPFSAHFLSLAQPWLLGPLSMLPSSPPREGCSN